MRYTKGSIGRIFVLKFEDDDVLLDALKAFVKKERLKAATMVFIGALKKGNLVTGPKKPVIPPEPNKVFFKDGWEVMGVGTIFTNAQGPQFTSIPRWVRNVRPLSVVCASNQRFFWLSRRSSLS